MWTPCPCPGIVLLLLACHLVGYFSFGLNHWTVNQLCLRVSAFGSNPFEFSAALLHQTNDKELFLPELLCRLWILNSSMFYRGKDTRWSRWSSLYALLIMGLVVVVCFVPYHFTQTNFFLKVYMPRSYDQSHNLLQSLLSWTPPVLCWAAGRLHQKLQACLWRKRRVAVCVNGDSREQSQQLKLWITFFIVYLWHTDLVIVTSSFHEPSCHLQVFHCVRRGSDETTAADCSAPCVECQSIKQDVHLISAKY